MVARKNRRFVIILAAAVLVGAGLVVGLGTYYIQNRPMGFIRAGDALAAQNKWKEASTQYERAVGYNRTNVEWLNKWHNALSKTIPDNRARYEEQYGFYRSILRTLSQLRSKDPDAVMAYAQELENGTRAMGASRDDLERIIEELDEHVEDLDPNDPKTKAILVYRGLAHVDRMNMLTLEPEVRELALKNLREGAEADPKNAEARVGVIRWHLAEIERMRKERVAESEIADMVAKASALMDAALKDMGNQPMVLLTKFLMDQNERMRLATSVEKRTAAITAMQADTLKFVNALLACPPEGLRVDLVDRIVGVVTSTGGPEVSEPALALIARALEQHPNDARLLLARGLIQQDRGEIAPAIATFQSVIDLPELPVSVEGLMLPSRRMSAMAAQVDASLVEWNNAKNDEERAKALDRAREFRQRLAAETGVRGELLLLLRDAKIAYAEKNYQLTTAKLSELRARGGTADPQVLQILAQALEQQGLRGEAIRVLEELRDRAPGLAWTYERMGDMYARDNRLTQAMEAYRTALQLNPANEAIKQRLATIGAATGVETPDGGTADPVTKALVDARKARQDGRSPEARAALEKLLTENAKDRRILRELLMMDMSEGNKDLAKARVAKALAAEPDDAQLKQLKTYMEFDDPVEAALKIIEESDNTPGQKALARFSVLINAKRGEEAKVALAEAEKLSPDDSSVVDMLFVVALGEKNFEKAQPLVQKAAKLNLDQVDGLLYQGRLELIECDVKPEKCGSAVSTFEQVVKRMPFNPTAKRLLAQAYQRVGRVADALDSFKRAYEGNPSDPTAVREYIGALIAANRGADALKVINPTDGALASNPNDAELFRTWIRLEAAYGDRAVALKTRETMYKQTPGDIDNAIGLVGLYGEDKRYDDASRVLDAVEAQKSKDVDALSIAGLRAQIDAAKGDIDAGAKRIRDAITDEMPKDQKLRAYLQMAAFFQQHGREDESLASTRKAAEYQDPNRMEADRSLGDLYFSRSVRLNPYSLGADDPRSLEKITEQAKKDSIEQMEMAIEHYQGVLKSSTDEGIRGTVQRRVAEAFLRVSRPADANKVIEQIAAKAPDDLQVLMLRGATLGAMNDRRAARQMYDRAVQLNPNNAGAFLQRALFNLREADPEVAKGLLPDILQDLEQTCRLSPTALGAWVRRFDLLKTHQRLDEGLTVLRSAIDANPGARDIRLLLMQELVSAGRLDEMQQEIERAITANKDDSDLLLMAARMYASPEVNRWRDAAKYFDQYYAIKPTPENAGILLDAQLRPDNSPTRQRVQELLAKWEPVAAKTVGDTMLRARALYFTGQESDADKVFSEALALVKEGSGKDAAEFVRWLSMAKGNQPREAMRWISTQAQRELHPFLKMQVIVLRSFSPRENPKNLIEEARSIIEGSDDQQTKFEGLKTIARLQYAIGDYEGAVVTMKEAMKISADDLELNNNLAYTLIANLNRVKEALPFAEKAAAIAPLSSTVLDTLGWAYYALPDYPKAVATLTRATETATAANDVFVAWLHLGHAQVKAGDRQAAREALRKAQDVASRPKDPPDAAKQPDYIKLMDELKKALE